MRVTMRRFSDNWTYVKSQADGDLTLRVFIDIFTNGLVKVTVRTLDGGLLRRFAGQVESVPYYNRNGKYTLAFRVRQYNYRNESTERFLDTERTTRAAAYRLADFTIREAVG